MLGIQWLSHINPYIDWRTRIIQFKHKNRQHVLRPTNHVADNTTNTANTLTVNQLSPSTLYSHSVGQLHSAAIVSPAQLTQQLLTEFGDVFPDQLPASLPPRRQINHSIQLIEGHKPPTTSPYKMNTVELLELKKQLTELLKQGFIRPSTSSYASGCLFVTKKDNSKRLCIDYRKINTLTVKQKYPIPDIAVLLEQLQGSTVFSKIDLRQGYHQVLMEPSSIPYTSFVTRYGQFEWTVLPFGLSEAPSTFMSLLQSIFFDLLDSCIIVYLDDLCIYSKSIEEHTHHLRLVLNRLRQHRLFAKLSKCEFYQSSITFLGHRVTAAGIKPEQEKVDSIVKWPIPNNKREVQQFVGLANFYRRFVNSFSQISFPLTQLTKDNQTFVWGPTQQQAFETLKKAITSAPVLALPDITKTFTLVTDASNVAIAATLLQNDHPVSFYSRKLKGAECNYSVYDKETLSLIEALKTWRHFLTAQRFNIITDNKALSYIQTQPLVNLSSRQRRWIELLQTFTFTIQHQPSKANHSDAITRRPDYLIATQHETLQTAQTNTSSFQVDLLEQIKDSYSLDRECQRLIQNPTDAIKEGFTSRDGVLYKTPNRIYIPDVPSIQRIILSEAHNSSTASHLGINKTVELLSRDYWFPQMHDAVKEWINRCPACQQNKSSTQSPLGLLQPHSIPPRPWHTVAMDFITDLPPTPAPHSKNALFVVTCKLTKMTHLIPMNISISAPEVAKLFFHHIVRLHGLPSIIISDRDVRFTSRFWRSLFTLCGTRLNFSTAHHPETDGQSERMVRTVEDLLRTQLNSDEHSWIEHLDSIEITINNSQQASTFQSPFYMNYGYHPTFTLNAANAETNNSTATELVKQIQDNLDKAKSNLSKAIERQKYYADQHRRDHTFQVNDLVYLSTKHIHLQNYISRKTKPLWIGPYKVVKVISPVAHQLELPNTMLIHPVFHISRLKPHRPQLLQEAPSTSGRTGDNTNTTPHLPPPVVVDNTPPLWEVERILGKRCRRNQIQYLVKWMNYPDHENSWEPESNLSQAQEAIVAWEAEQQQQAQPHRQTRHSFRRGRV